MNDPSTEYSHERPDVWGRRVVISDNGSIYGGKPLITEVSLSSNTIYRGDKIMITASVLCEDNISTVKCNFKTTDDCILDSLELQFDNDDNYKNTWVAPSDLDQSTDIRVDMIAVDMDGDTTQMNNAASFQVYMPVLLLDKPYSGDSYKVFDDSNIAEIRLTIEQDSLDKLYAPGNEGNNNYLPAGFSFINDNISLTTIPEVGIRLRGAISRYSQKRDFKISFNEFVPGRNFYGLTKLNLRGLNRDPSIIREKICLDLLKDMNVIAARASYVKLYINDEYYGLYLNVEEVDRNFLNAHFGNDNGNLYKCAREANLSIRPDSDYKFTFGPPPYAPHQIDRAYELCTNEDEDDYSDLINLIEVINNTPDNNFRNELVKIFNIHPFLKAQAISVIAGDWDGFWFNQNNYYLYYNTWADKFEFIPRDLDLTLGVDWGGGEHATSDIYYYGPRNDDRPLINRMFNVSEYIGEYSKYVKQLIDTCFSIDKQWPKIGEIKEMIQTAAEEDYYRILDYGWSINDFNNSYNNALGTFHAIDFAAPFDLVTRNPYGLKPFIEIRDSAASSQLDISHIPPVISNTSHFPLSPGRYDQVTITSVVTSYTYISSVTLNYNTGNGFQCAKMYDDGMHNDGEAGDQKYGTIIPSYPDIKRVFYYVSAQGTGFNEISASPENAPYTSFYYTVGYQKPSVVINEFMADNENTIIDEAGENEDWLELYNFGTKTIQLGGMYLTDNLLNPTKWQIPEIQIDPGEFLLFWADDDQEQGPMHTNFKLSRDGEQIGLFDTDENANLPIDIMIFISQNNDQSYGRLSDGSNEWGIFANSTPGKSNQTIPTNIEQKIMTSGSANPVLYQNYPNPFRTATTIDYKIKDTEYVEIYICNLLGQRITTLVSDIEPAGNYSVEWNAVNLADGIYVCTLRTNSGEVSCKMIKAP
jgi:spore coat protein CotH